MAVLFLVLPVSGCHRGAGNSLRSTSDGSALRIHIASEPDYLDPALSSTVDSGTLAQNSFVGLFTTDEQGRPQPALCDRYTLSDDGRTYTFVLKDGLTWSDGTPLSAKDFAWSWKRAADPQTGATYSYLFDAFEKDRRGRIRVDADDNVLTAHLQAPCAYFLDLCAFPTFLPVPKAAVTRADPDHNNPGKWASEAGFPTNGPYVLKEWKHNESMIYEKNPRYYEAERVRIPQLQFMLTSDSTSAYAAYNAGNLDFCSGVPTDIAASLLSRADYHKSDTLGTYYISFNVNSDLFRGMSEEKATTVRKALSLLIDRNYIVENIGQLGQKVATSFIPYDMSDGSGGTFKSAEEWNYPDPASLGYFPAEYHAAEAKQQAIRLLKSVGYEFNENGHLSPKTPIAFDYTINADSGHQAIGEALQSDWGQIGVTCKIKTQEWNTFVADRRAGKITCARDGWVADFNDPITMLDLFTSYSDNNNCQFGKDPGNPSAPKWDGFDALIARIKTTTDMAERVRLMHEAEDMIMGTWAVIPLYYYTGGHLCKTNIKGVYGTPFGMKLFCYATVEGASSGRTS